mgnify:CR=1 FL=1|jgi:hypothetical protein
MHQESTDIYKPLKYTVFSGPTDEGPDRAVVWIKVEGFTGGKEMDPTEEAHLYASSFYNYGSVVFEMPEL